MVSALFLISFVGRWNDYVWPLIITSRESMRTLPVGLSYLREIQGAGGQWNLIMAASVFVIFPTLVLFLFAQKQFVSGLTGGALKG
jgi:ABC-type glycerol-3-phosphate transport system permease component